MKSILIILMGLFISQVLFAQTRIASTVTFTSGDETIEGILIRPNPDDKVPAVVFQQGSGNHSFDGYEKEAWGPHKYYIEDVLLEQGYAILYCNKRGLGNSTGNWKKNDFYGRADDAYAAVEFLKSRPDIDASRIGISGHSQGGWIAQIAASRHEDIAFVISMAGPTVGVRAQTSMYDSLMYLCNGFPQDKLGKKMEKYHKRKRTSANIGKALPFIKSAYYWHLIIDYDNDEVLKNLKCPTLLLFAEHDANVPPEQNIGHLKELFDNNPPSNFIIKVMKGGQHGFYMVEDRCVDWGTAEQQPFDPQFQEEIRNWLIRLD
jgi:dipeptidyl aminopeptidase/acylaminoacyl peptidase